MDEKTMKQYGYIETDPKMPLYGEYASTSYGMFTEAGDILVDGIVDVAKGTDASWPWTYEKLEMLGKTKGFEEATDTMVRELVFDAIGYSDDTPFYI
jgi:hypothetical protein|tara:strand:+ start:1810 stop:2100 length:291 start_codon:yes stop_codon:yes gene_type:complete